MRLPTFCSLAFFMLSGLALAAPKSEPQIEGLSPPRLAALGDQLDQEAKAGKLPGSILLVKRNGKLVYARVSGELDPKTHAQMRGDAIFHVFSMTKPIVSVAVMRMVEDGRLMMNDPIARYFPVLRDLKVGVEKVDAEGKITLERVPALRPVTIQDLLRHTSGFTYSNGGKSLVREEYKKAKVDSGSESCEDFLAKLATVPLLNQPATAYEYGVSTDVLGCLLEKLSGQTLAEHLRERVFAPLEMNDTGFWVPENKWSRMAEAFEADPDTRMPINLPRAKTSPKFFSGGAGLYSTASDYMKFAEMLLGSGMGLYGRLLSPKTVEFMLADHLASIRDAAPGAAVLGPRPGFSMGLGLAVRTEPGGATPGSLGMADWNGAGGTVFWIDPKEHLAVVWMAEAPGRMPYYRQLVLNRVYGAFEK